MPDNTRDFLAGEVLLVNKPQEWTSFDVVNKLRWSLRNALKVKKIKVGHAGTLDPMATGLLIICTGKGTKKINDYVGLDKEYSGTMRLGEATPTYDAESEVSDKFSTDDLTPEAIQAAAAKFVGEQLQVPPAYSAKRVDGERAYELIRRGEEVKLAPCLITIHELELTRIELPEVDFRVVCSKGTYIRSLAHDLGKVLNNGAHLTALCRTRIGEFTLDQALGVPESAEMIATSATPVEG